LAGDHRAFAEFIDKYKEMVFLCCCTLGLRTDEAEDVASETFLTAYKALRRYRGQAKLSTWLWRIAYCKAVDYLRKNRKYSQLLDELDGQIADDRQQNPRMAAQGREREQIVWDAVGRLPRLWAMAVILHYREEKKITDIAKIMKIRQNTVKTYLFRARNRLKELIGPVLEGDINGG
jgi:RNA polymerase sigma-70 factor (ECF subfamily)